MTNNRSSKYSGNSSEEDIGKKSSINDHKNPNDKSNDRLSATLIIIYNYHYLMSNIEKIESIYKKRFSSIYHLLPISDSEYAQRLASSDKNSDKSQNKFEHIKMLAAAIGKKDAKFPKNVIRVRGSAHEHQAFLVQAYKHYKSKTNHYLFIQDDALLHPQIDENNYYEFFKISEDDGFLEKIYEFENSSSLLPWKENFRFKARRNKRRAEGKILKPNLLNYLRYSIDFRCHIGWDGKTYGIRNAYDCYIDEKRMPIKEDLASYDDALNLFKEHGLSTEHIDREEAAKRTRGTTTYSRHSYLSPRHPIHSMIDNNNFKQIVPKNVAVESGNHTSQRIYYRIKEMLVILTSTLYVNAKEAFRYYRELIRAIFRFCLTGKDTYRTKKLSYPIARSPSDVFIVPAKDMPRFLSHCDLFVGLSHEIAIPTALLLSTQKIVQISSTDYKKYNYIVDGEKQVPLFTQQLKTIDSMITNWPEDYLYVHPIKLSILNGD